MRRSRSTTRGYSSCSTSNDRARLQALFEGAREAFGEVKAHEDQRAWNEDVRAFAVAMIRDVGVPRTGPTGGGLNGDMRPLITGAVNMANEVEIHRQSRARHYAKK